MPRIIEDSELTARLRLHRLQIAALLTAGALLRAGLQALPEGGPLELGMDTRLGATD